MGHESLSKIRTHLNEKFSYDAIRLVRAQWLQTEGRSPTATSSN
nr:hypothetical protein [[Limnothrix rosea] IAM M-220]